MQMRTIVALVMTALMGVSAQAGTKIDDPVAFVRSVYLKLATDKNFQEPDDIYTARLAALFALEKKDAGGEVGRMDFDFWTNAQDWSLRNVKISGGLVEGAKDREVVTAKFHNIDRSEIIQFYFENSKDGWKLDDARSLTKDGWTLSLILKYGWVTAK